MEISSYELFELPPRWLFLRIETTTGVVGWGEPIVEGQRRAVKEAVETLIEEYLIGSDPLRIEYHWQQMYRGGFYRGGPILMSAISGIDQALWDIKGKHFGVPAHRLLGGPVRNEIEVYHWISGDTIVDLPSEIAQSLDNGFRVIKLNATGRLRNIESTAKINQLIDQFGSIFDALPENVDVIFDFHGRTSRIMASRLLNSLESYQPLFVEEPVRPEFNKHLSQIAPTTIPLATGERLYNRWDCRDVIESGIIDIIQPNVSHAGGITELRKIASQAETHGVSVSPVSSVGPISFAASLQIDAAVNNFIIQEQTTKFAEPNSTYNQIVENKDDFALEEGFVPIPNQPGLGVSLEVETIRELSGRSATDWSTPTWRHEDGSLAEW